MSETNNQNDVNISSSQSHSSSSGSSHSSHHHHHHRRRKKNTTRIIVVSVLAIILIVVIVAIAAGTNNSSENTPGAQNTSSTTESTKEGTSVYYVGSSKDKNNRYDFATVNDAINEWRSQNNSNQAVIIRNTTTSDKIYRVGAGRTLSNLKEAVAQWNADGQPSATILVDSGTYITTSNPDEGKDPLTILPKNSNQLNIIGEDKNSTIVKSTTGKYIHPAILIKGGNVTVKNITFLADHTTNSSFKYREKDGYNSAYAVHCDGGSISGVVVFENCNMWSWQSCGFGSGTITNSHIVVKGCDIRSFTEGYAVDPNPQFATEAEEEEHAKFVHGSRGAIIYHTYAAANGVSNESFTLMDSYVYAKNCSNTVQVFNRMENGQQYEFKMLTFVNNIFTNDFEFCNNVVVPNGVYLGNNSSGNNVNSVNSKNGEYSLIIEN